MTNQEQKVKYKKSIFAEINSLSITAGIGILILMLACIAGYIYLIIPTPKKVLIDDSAEVLTKEEEEDLEDLAEDLSSRRDMNVIIITTRDKGKGYTDSDEDCAEYCLDQYDKIVRKNKVKDNSGMIIFLDLTIDEPGERFFWMYTYGSTFLAIDDNEINRLFEMAKPGLEEQDYEEAFESILKEVKSRRWNKEKELSGTVVAAVIPVVLAIIIYKKTGKIIIDKKPSVRTNRVTDALVDHQSKLINKESREELSPQGVAAQALATSAAYSSSRSYRSSGGSYRSSGSNYRSSSHRSSGSSYRSSSSSHRSSGSRSHGSHGGRGGGGRF